MFQPTEYTCLVMQYLCEHDNLISGRSVCEIGTGNGAIAGQAALLGACEVTVSDVEQVGLQMAKACHDALPPHGARFDYLLGPMWDPFESQKFDLILANLPHFPALPFTLPDRLPSWSSGGSDGRALLDPFIEGLPEHLSPNGRAVFTHNRFSDLEQTKAKLETLGLNLCTSHETIVLIPPVKVAALANGAAGYGDDVFTRGPFTFGRLCLAIATWAG